MPTTLSILLALTATFGFPALAQAGDRAGALPDDCVETFFQANGGGALGGAVYFDLAVVETTTIGSLLANFSSMSGTPVGLEIYTTPVTYDGVETDPSQWVLAAVDDGTATSAGFDVETPITLAAPMTLPPGTTGIALVALGAAHAYTNGSGTNQVHMSADGNLTLTAGSASNTPFQAAVFRPRVWNGRICPVLGASYCTAVPNSTGSVGTVTASGSAAVSVNSVILRASHLPANQFGLFAVSATQDFVVGAGGTSSGNLCLGAPVGRLGGGAVLSTGPEGAFSIPLDLTAVPIGGQVVSVAAGDTLNVQAWHRDAVGLGSNFTEGLSVQFQ